MAEQRGGKMWAFMHDSLHEIYQKLRETGGREEYHRRLDSETDKLVEGIEARFTEPLACAEVVAWKADNGQWAATEKDAQEYEKRMHKKMWPLIVKPAVVIREQDTKAAKAEWVMKVPVVSNRHIPKELPEWLREHEFNDDVADMPGGWMICVHADIDYVDLDPWGAMERLKQFMKLNYPELIADGLAWVRFDVDGDEYAGLEDYDW